jgi:group I intron endonuclease
MENLKLKMTTGIYAIVCNPTNKVYIGQSINIRSRKNQHVKDLLMSKHCNSYLQNTFNKYGRSAFSFRVLENCSKEELTSREAYWIQKYKSNISEFGFNLKEAGDAPCSEEHRKACGDITKTRNVEKYGMWIIFNLQTGEWFESPSRKEYGMENKSYNYKRHYVAFRDWTLEDFKKHYEGYNYYQFCQNGIDHSGNFTDPKKVYAKNLTTGEVLEFPSISGAGRSLGIKARAISNVTNGRKLSTGGYTFSTTTEFPEQANRTCIPVFVLDKEGCRYYDNQYTAASQEFLDDTHASSYIKDFVDTERTHKGCRFFTTPPTEVDIVRAKFNLTPQEALTYKVVYENKVIAPKQLPSPSKSRNQKTKKKLIELNLITQCPTTFSISLVN